MVTKVVLKDKSAGAVKARKESKQYRKKNKTKLNAEARRSYKTMSQAEKHKHLEQQVFTRAMRHGATEAEAKKAVAAYKKRRKNRLAGKHAAGKTKAAHDAQRDVRNNIRKQANQVRDAHRAALAKIKTAGGTPAQRSKMRQAEKKRYSADRTKLASMRKKAVGKHQTLLRNIKKKSPGAFRLQDFISNYSKTPISRKGKRLKNVDPTAAIADKHFGKTTGSAKKKVPAGSKKPAAASAAGPRLKKDGTPAKTPGRKKKVADAPAAPAVAEAPVKRSRGRPKMTEEQRAAKAAAKAAATPVAAKAAKAAKTAAKPAAAKAAKAAAKPVAEKAAKAAAKPAAAKAAKAPAKAAAAKAAKAPAKAAAKEAAKPVAKKAATKVAKETATKVAKAAVKGGAVPKKSSNKRASLS